MERRVTLEKIVCYQDGSAGATAWEFQIFGVVLAPATAQRGPNSRTLLDIPARNYDDSKGETVLQMAFTVPADVSRLQITGKGPGVFGTSVSESVSLGSAKTLEVRIQAKNPKDGDFLFVFRVEQQYPAAGK